MSQGTVVRILVIGNISIYIARVMQKPHEMPAPGLSNLGALLAGPSLRRPQGLLSGCPVSLMKARQQRSEAENVSLLYSQSVYQGLWDPCAVSHYPTDKGYLG